MEQVLVRKIPKKIVAGLDELSKKAGISREEYIRQLLTTHVESVEIQGVKTNYEELVRMSLMVIQNNTEALDKFYKINGGDLDD